MFSQLKADHSPTYQRLTDMPNSRQVIFTNKAPKSLGPDSQGIRMGSTVYVSSQLGVDPKTNGLVEGGVAAETRQALTNIKYILKAAGTSLDLALKCTVSLTDIEDFDEMNKVYAEFFPSAPPARSTTVVGKFPLGARVAIDAIAGVDTK